MSASPPVVRRGEYAARGDYHRAPDPSWDYYPTYLAKLEAVRRWLDPLPASTRVLDAGCGEGVLVDEYAARLAIEGVDANYSSERVTTGVADRAAVRRRAFDRALCLDVLEHLTFEEQPRALGGAASRPPVRRRAAGLGAEPGAPAVARALPAARAADPHGGSEPSIPAIAPPASTSSSARRAGFALVARRGIFPTVPVLTRLIRRHPRALLPLHRWLTRLLPVPGWCFLNLLTFRKP